MSNRQGDSSVAKSFKNLAGIRSGPAAFEGSRSCRILRIPEIFSSISKMLGKGAQSKDGGTWLLSSCIKTEQK